MDQEFCNAKILRIFYNNIIQSTKTQKGQIYKWQKQTFPSLLLIKLLIFSFKILYCIKILI